MPEVNSLAQPSSRPLTCAVGLRLPFWSSGKHFWVSPSRRKSKLQPSNAHYLPPTVCCMRAGLIAATDSAFDVARQHVCGTRIDVMGYQCKLTIKLTRQHVCLLHPCTFASKSLVSYIYLPKLFSITTSSPPKHPPKSTNPPSPAAPSARPQSAYQWSRSCLHYSQTQIGAPIARASPRSHRGNRTNASWAKTPASACSDRPCG